MLSPLSEGRVSVKTVTDRDRQSVRVIKWNGVGKTVNYVDAVCVPYLVRRLVKGWWGRSVLLLLHRELPGKEETHKAPDLHKKDRLSLQWTTDTKPFTSAVYVFYLLERPAALNQSERLMSEATDLLEVQTWTWWTDLLPEENWGGNREHMNFWFIKWRASCTIFLFLYLCFSP